MWNIQPIPQYPVINGSVTLSLGIEELIFTASWYKGPNATTPYYILAYYPGPSPITIPGPLYNTRNFIVFSNGSLHIRDLQITDGGNYIAKILAVTQEDKINVTLTVYEPVTKPEITASITQPRENNMFTLTCDTSRATITWTRRGTSISSETQLSENNRTLIFPSVQREDSGEYKCEAQNLVIKEFSEPYTVTVAYGPDKAVIEGPAYVRPGSSITLTCSADSFPPPEYQWKVNDTVLEEKTNKYDTSNAEIEDQGIYTCVVRNPVTLRTATAFVYVTAEFIHEVNENSIGLGLGLAFAIILGVVLIIGSFCLYRKFVKKRRNESSENREEPIPIYENFTAAQPQEDFSYMAEQPQGDSSYMAEQPQEDSSYMEAQPEEESSYMAEQPQEDSSYMEAQPQEDSSYMVSRENVNSCSVLQS
ncbi:cell adhesion molecule CEACAM8-like [Rhinoderma darwinii]|uniref:cell adhesion molecule CEACAM8-like n=1 Tax=Rhinoderma darwinii TaxID=43563 RepID=UPI003F66D7B0